MAVPFFKEADASRFVPYLASEEQNWFFTGERDMVVRTRKMADAVQIEHRGHISVTVIKPACLDYGGYCGVSIYVSRLETDAQVPGEISQISLYVDVIDPFAP